MNNSHFAAVWLDAQTKLQVLAGYVKSATKRLFGVLDFASYR